MNIRYALYIIPLSIFSLYLTGCDYQRKDWSDYHNDEALHYLSEELDLTSTQSVKVKQVLEEISGLKMKRAVMKSDWNSFIQDGLTDNKHAPNHQQFIEQQMVEYKSLLENVSEQLLTLRSVLTVEQLKKLRSSINILRRKHDQ